MEIKNAIILASSKQRESQLKQSHEILDLSRAIISIHRQTQKSLNIKVPEALHKHDLELSLLIRTYNDKAHGEFLLNPLESNSVDKPKPSTLSKIKSALSMHRFLQKSDSKIAVGTIESILEEDLIEYRYLIRAKPSFNRTLHDQGSQTTLPKIYPAIEDKPIPFSFGKPKKFTLEKTALLKRLYRPAVVRQKTNRK